MAEQLAHANKLNPSVISRGEALSLLDWVNVSWFYPEEFLLQEITANEQSISARGPHETYSFLLPIGDGEKANNSELFNKWISAVEEIADHRVFAPNYYLGIRTIGWADGDPKWLDDRPLDNYDSDIPSSDATDIAIVSRAAPESSSLLGALKSNAENKEKLLDRTVRRLLRYQQSQYLQDPDALAEIVDAHSDMLRQQLSDLRVSLKLQSVEQLIVDELYSYLIRQGLELRKKLVQRSEGGFFLDGHANLLPENILFELNGQELKRPEFIGRKPRGSFLRISDVMSDLANLILNLSPVANQQEIEGALASYKRRAPENYDEQLLLHYIVAHAVNSAHQALLSSSKDSAQKLFEIRLNLATAFRWKLAANSPVVVVVHSTCENEFFRSLTKCIADFIGAPRLSVTSKSGNVRKLDSVLNRNRSLVIELSTSDPIRKQEIAEELRVQNLRPFFVRCEGNREMVLTGAIDEPGHYGNSQRSVDISLRLPPAWNESLLQPTAPESILARDVLRGVMSRKLLAAQQ